jgi:hypothetical protein
MKAAMYEQIFRSLPNEWFVYGGPRGRIAESMIVNKTTGHAFRYVQDEDNKRITVVPLKLPPKKS